jgi:inosine/xanthosine triphosphate pyrophosphatase family protein
LLGKDDPRAYFSCIILFCQGPGSYELFEGRCHGKIIEPGSVQAPAQFPLLSMFVPDGMTKTLAELHNSPEVQNITHRHKALVAFVEWWGRQN